MPVEGGVAGLEIALGGRVALGVDLVDAGGGPQRAVQLQADQVRQGTALPEEGAVPEIRLAERFIGGVQRQL